MKKRIIILFVLFFVGVATFVWWGQRKNQQRELFYSGTIESTQAHLAFQIGGRVDKVPVKEGQAVVTGQVLAELDVSEFQSRVQQAQANLDKSQKSKEQLGDVLDIYRTTLPADVARAEANAKNARELMDEARKNKQRYEQLFKQGFVSEKEKDTVRLNYETSFARLTESEAILRQARGNLRKIDASRKEIEGSEAQSRQAKAALEQTDIQLAYTKIHAPFNGIVTSRNIEPGEVVTPGREVLTLSNLANVDLKIFVEETEIAKVKVGQKVEVKVDTFPDKSYQGTVAFISQEGEFTPKIIQTRKERVKLVYLVKVSIPNPNLELKAGMPADAWLR